MSEQRKTPVFDPFAYLHVMSDQQLTERYCWEQLKLKTCLHYGRNNDRFLGYAMLGVMNRCRRALRQRGVALPRLDL